MPAAVCNVAREQLEHGQLALGIGARIHAQCRDRQAMMVAGFDWPFLDTEHGMMSPDAAQPHQPPASTNTGLRLY
jgi:4-hydroxy-2-oxoheptanedioate aldolase